MRNNQSSATLTDAVVMHPLILSYILPYVEAKSLGQFYEIWLVELS